MEIKTEEIKKYEKKHKLWKTLNYIPASVAGVTMVTWFALSFIPYIGKHGKANREYRVAENKVETLVDIKLKNYEMPEIKGFLDKKAISTLDEEIRKLNREMYEIRNSSEHKKYKKLERTKGDIIVGTGILVFLSFPFYFLSAYFRDKYYRGLIKNGRSKKKT